jgi:hypothetical protein
VVSKLLERLQALAETVEAIREKAAGKNGRKLDGLAVARTLVAVDSAANKLAGLAEQLTAGLFEDGGGD